MEARPLAGSEHYDLAFTDWVNEWESVHAAQPAPRPLPSALRRLKMKMERSSRTCSVCLGPFRRKQTIYRLPCAHIFHCECLEGWLRTGEGCPNCRGGLGGDVRGLSNAEG